MLDTKKSKKLEKQVAEFADWYKKDNELVASYEVVRVEDVAEWILMNKEQVLKLLK